MSKRKDRERAESGHPFRNTSERITGAIANMSTEAQMRALNLTISAMPIKRLRNNAITKLLNSARNNYSPLEGSKYPSAEAEVEYLVGLVPVIKERREEFLKVARGKREEYGLPV